MNISRDFLLRQRLSVPVKWGGQGRTTGGIPCIIHMLASSVECEGWDAGGSSACLGEHPGSSGGWLAGIHTTSQGWLNNIRGDPAKLCCASCLSTSLSGWWRAVPHPAVTSEKLRFWAKQRHCCLNAKPPQICGKKPETQLSKPFNFVLKPSPIYM